MVARFLIVFLLLAGTAVSQDFNAYVDGYWGYNFNNPLSQINDFRIFDINHNKFSLNYGEVTLEQKAMPVGFRIDVGFGDAKDIVHSSELSSWASSGHVQQAYVSLAKGKLTADFGKWVTPAGAEVIETKDNWNYSRGFLFQYAIPFYHFGLRANYEASENLTLGAHVTNGWNNVEDTNQSKTFGFMATIKRGKLTYTGNYIVGREGLVFTSGATQFGRVSRHLFDNILRYDFSDKVSFLANYDYGMDRDGLDQFAVKTETSPRTKWQGIAVYAQLSPTEKFKISPRFEWFDDPQGATTGISWANPDETSLKEFTITGRWELGEGAHLWTEYRHDWAYSGLNIFEDSTNGVSGFTDKQDTIAIGLTYNFNRMFR